jgi:hypothetical protein
MGRCVATNVPNGKKQTASLMYIYPGWLAHEGGWREKKAFKLILVESFSFIHITFFFFIASILFCCQSFLILLLVKAYSYTFIYTILLLCGSTATNPLPPFTHTFSHSFQQTLTVSFLSSSIIKINI